MSEEIKNPRDLFQPKFPETKKPCASCPFSEDNDAEFGQVVEKLQNAAHGPYPPETPPEAIRAQIDLARRRIKREVDRNGEFACHCTVYDDDMTLKDMKHWRQCAGATKFYKEQGLAKVKEIQSRKKRKK